MEHTLEKNILLEKRNTESYILYLKSPNKVIDTTSGENICRDLNSDIDIVKTWAEIFSKLSNTTKCDRYSNILILVDYAIFAGEDRTPPELISMVSSFYTCLHMAIKPKIAVIIETLCKPAIIKMFQSTEIQGLVPCLQYFDYKSTILAMKEILAGRSHWPKDLIDHGCTNRITIASGVNLTSRQREVADLICSRGLSNKKIAQALNISESTVKIHISSILKEYGVQNRTQLVLAARKY